MKTQTTIAVIGGTGKSGQYLIKQLLQQSFAIRVIVRDHPHTHLNDPKITVIQGDARDLASVKALVTGADAVISTIGQRGNELPIFSVATANVIQTMHEEGIHRYIITTGLSVNTLADQKSPWVTQATDWMYTHYPSTTSDKQTEYELLENSRLDWTLIRLPLIELTDETPSIVTSLTDCPSNKISAPSLATFLAGQLSDKTFYRAAPFLANVS
ncbi:NAD(P)-dependent oxidoreductase [Chitinophaga sp. CF418]|uniref:NAD(P)-dependent oxidoreductase n=1 Tax=Chitinophaga sp. CF418 TaxID=1855287 RepID=UPI000911D6D6|nr:NAD(P)H-binding protein [Chitinophaga sp. CF418]SHM75913.1 Putative NADH-flavin reductase [Chitinophaga sp. CF418]